MLRNRLIAAAIIVLSVALAGCTSSSLPSWMGGPPPVPPTQALQFESDPPGADARTSQGQNCRTPCALAVPVASQSVTFAKAGYLPQTITVELRQPGEGQPLDSNAPASALSPNPVAVVLQSAKPPKPVMRPKPRKPVARVAPATAAPPPPQPPQNGSPFPPPPPV